MCIRDRVNTLLNDKLAPYLEENPAVAKAILEKSINAARVREAAQKARELARKKSGLSSTRMPEKLADCIWSDKMCIRDRRSTLRASSKVTSGSWRARSNACGPSICSRANSPRWSPHKTPYATSATTANLFLSLIHI